MKLSGMYKLNNKTDPFTGTITFEERNDLIYYSWNLYDQEGKFLGHKSIPIPFHQIPAGQDRFEFSKGHAIEGIRQFRIGRQKVIEELSVEWRY